jgi:hypothetical protein
MTRMPRVVASGSASGVAGNQSMAYKKDNGRAIKSKAGAEFGGGSNGNGINVGLFRRC